MNKIPIDTMQIEGIAIALLGAFAGGFLTYFGVVRRIHHSAVIQERQAWREKMRSLAQDLAIALEINDQERIKFIRREMKVRLNPKDYEDRLILNCTEADELSSRISVMMKHDWERAKLEASFFRGLFWYAFRPEYVSKDQIYPTKFLRFRFFRVITIVITLIISPWIAGEIIVPFVEWWLNEWRSY